MNDDMNPDSQVLNDRDANSLVPQGAERDGQAKFGNAARLCAELDLRSKSESNPNAGLTEVLERGERSRKGRS